MPIQFPNFLSVPVRTPDYSGLGDIVNNYYAGKAMPKDDLIKAIQAEFARPNAEETLKGLRLGNTGKSLSNRKEQLDIDRLVREASEQKAFEAQLRQALAAGAGAGGGNGSGGGAMPSYPSYGAASPVAPTSQGSAPAASPNSGSMPAPMSAGSPNMVGVTTDLSSSDGIDPTKMAPRYRKFDQEATGLPDNAYRPMAGSSLATPQAPMAPIMPNAQPQEEEPHEIVVTRGAPHLAAVDAMWDNNPRSRPFLEKQGYKKTQDIKFNAKTGQTTVVTKYPSGTITTKTVGSLASSTGDGIPLTNKMISQHQQMIAAIDNAKPVIQEIIDQKGFQPYPRSTGMGLVPGWMGQAATYDGLVKSALDTLMKAYGLPSTNEGINTVKDQLLIGHGETAGHYRNRLRALIKDLDRRKAYSSQEVKKSNKIQPVDASAGGGQSYSSDEWEVANDEQ